MLHSQAPALLMDCFKQHALIARWAEFAAQEPPLTKDRMRQLLKRIVRDIKVLEACMAA